SPTRTSKRPSTSRNFNVEKQRSNSSAASWTILQERIRRSASQQTCASTSNSLKGRRCCIKWRYLTTSATWSEFSPRTEACAHEPLDFSWQFHFRISRVRPRVTVVAHLVTHLELDGEFERLLTGGSRV